MKKILAGQKTTQARVSIKLPDKASVGTRIPFTASVDLPITQESYITTLHVLGTKSPKALIAQFNLTALSGKAEISGTLHLNEPQDIIAIARTNDNQFFTGRRQVQFDL
ncbi:MAG: thiosulfate oxidation carrier protein SoxY [Pseudomonadota bacterium]